MGPDLPGYLIFGPVSPLKDSPSGFIDEPVPDDGGQLGPMARHHHRTQSSGLPRPSVDRRASKSRYSGRLIGLQFLKHHVQLRDHLPGLIHRLLTAHHLLNKIFPRATDRGENCFVIVQVVLP